MLSGSETFRSSKSYVVEWWYNILDSALESLFFPDPTVFKDGNLAPFLISSSHGNP